MTINPSNQDPVEHKKRFTDVICQGLQNVSANCFLNKLTDCYTDEDSQFHLAFLLEELRLTGRDWTSLNWGEVRVPKK